MMMYYKPYSFISFAYFSAAVAAPEATVLHDERGDAHYYHVLTGLVFYLQPDFVEKVSMGITVLLDLSVLLLNMPKVSDYVLLLGKLLLLLSY